MKMAQRAWLYGVILAVVPLAVAYGLVSEETAPLWLAVAAAVLIGAPPALALKNLTPDEETDK